MKIVHPVFLFSIILFLASCKTDNRQVTSDLIHFPPSADIEDSDAPKIEFDSSVCHFGIIAIGEKYTHTFRFKNTGKSPLIISQVTPSCGCTTSKEWPHDPITPGEFGEIVIEFNSKGFPGKIDKNISVLTNCLPKVWDLKMLGEVSGVESESKDQKHIEMEMVKP